MSEIALSRRPLRIATLLEEARRLLMALCRALMGMLRSKVGQLYPHGT